MRLPRQGEGGLTPRGDAPLLIIGAGVCGLATALCAARAGHSVHILESRDAFHETGAGLQLGPHAVKVLVALGLGDVLKPIASAPADILIRGLESGKPICRIPLGARAEARYGAPYWCLHRQDLHRALAGAVAASPRITATFGFRAGRLAEDSDGIRVSDDKGRSFEGQGLIGADGLWSSTRRAMESDAGSPSQARFSGYVAWRTVLAKPMDQGSDLGSVSLWLGADAHAVHYPVAAGRLFNLVVVRREPPGMEDYEQIGDRDAMLEDTARWPRPVRDLVAAAPDWRRWPLFLRDEGSAWYSGRVLLAGDAAHPLLPFLAQGAAMALEDAWAIGRALGQPDRSIEAAWRDVEQLRLPRVRRVVRASARNAQSFHLSGPLRLARDAAMRMMGGDRLLSAYDWLYGHAETEHRAPAR